MATEPLPIPPEIIPTQLSEDAYIALRKLEYDHALARLGLQGTLWRAGAAIVTIIIIVMMPVFTPITAVRGYEVVGIVAVFVIPIVSYGAFIFDRAFKISATAGAHGSSLEASTTGAVTQKK